MDNEICKSNNPGPVLVPEMGKYARIANTQNIPEEDVNRDLAYKNALLQLKVERLEGLLKLSENFIRDMKVLNDNLLDTLKNTLSAQGLEKLNKEVIRNGEEG